MLTPALVVVKKLLELIIGHRKAAYRPSNLRSETFEVQEASGIGLSRPDAPRDHLEPSIDVRRYWGSRV